MAQAICAASLTGSELMSRFSLALVTKHHPQMRLGFCQEYPQYVQLEISDSESEELATAMLESLVSEALEKDVLSDAIVALSIAQSKALWSLGEHITLAHAVEGKHTLKYRRTARQKCGVRYCGAVHQALVVTPVRPDIFPELCLVPIAAYATPTFLRAWDNRLQPNSLYRHRAQPRAESPSSAGSPRPVSRCGRIRSK